jgi:cellulose synthase/poly-beta-1,6-N-acetylglucosamine synthase-like glycosyltransferase
MTEAAFWIILALIAFSLFGYGLLWIVLARVAGRAPYREAPEVALGVTVLIAARNEEAVIGRKLESILAQDVAPHELDVMVISDGSEDRTIEEAQALRSPRVRCFALPRHDGKAAALNYGLAGIDADVVVFSDANSILKPGSLNALLAPFADPETGGTCGRPKPKLVRDGWIGRAEQLFWNHDNMLKEAETRLGGAVSAQGTLYAVRRHLLPTVVPPDMADDFYVSVQVPSSRKRLVFVPEAVATEIVTARVNDEFFRRVRSTERGWRGVLRMRRLLNPFAYGLYAVQLFCHKVLRRLTAFLLPALFLVTLALVRRGPVYELAAAAQVLFYGLAISAIVLPAARSLPGATAAAFFVLGHAAMALGILRASAGRRSVRWSPARERLR